LEDYWKTQIKSKCNKSYTKSDGEVREYKSARSLVAYIHAELIPQSRGHLQELEKEALALRIVGKTHPASFFEKLESIVFVVVHSNLAEFKNMASDIWFYHRFEKAISDNPHYSVLFQGTQMDELKSYSSHKLTTWVNQYAVDKLKFTKDDLSSNATANSSSLSETKEACSNCGKMHPGGKKACKKPGGGAYTEKTPAAVLTQEQKTNLAMHEKPCNYKGCGGKYHSAINCNKRMEDRKEAIEKNKAAKAGQAKKP
jgi:hypothetical protein